MFCDGVLPSALLRQRAIARAGDTGAGSGDNPPPTGADNGEHGTPPAGLTEEQWKLAFEHPRFKELTKQAKDAKAALEKLESDRKTAEETRLKEQENFKALWEKAEADKAAALAEAERVKAERIADAKRAAIQAAAARANFHPQAAAEAHRFIDLAAVPLTDAGAVDAAAVEKAVKALGEAQPYMLGAAGRQDPGSPPNRLGGQPPTDKDKADFERALRASIIR